MYLRTYSLSYTNFRCLISKNDTKISIFEYKRQILNLLGRERNIILYLKIILKTVRSRSESKGELISIYIFISPGK